MLISSRGGFNEAGEKLMISTRLVDHPHACLVRRRTLTSGAFCYRGKEMVFNWDVPGRTRMQDDLDQILEKLKREMEDVWRQIPKAYRNDHSIRRTLQCHLYGRLRSMGGRVLADYMPPRILDRPVDLIMLNKELQIEYAVCLDTVVTLAAVKSLSSFEAINKVIFTTGMLEKKVQESRFFLKPEMRHVHLRPFQDPF